MMQSPDGKRLEANASIELRSVEGRGRGLFWSPLDGTSICTAGTTLLRVDPVAAALHRDELTLRCSYCFSLPSRERSDEGEEKLGVGVGGSNAAPSSPGTDRGASPSRRKKLQRCSSCKMARYCSGECQRQDWERVHFRECRALRWYKKQQTAAGDGGKVTVPNTRIRMLSRMLWSRRVTEKDIGGITYQDLQSRAFASVHAKEDEKREAQLFERFVAAGEDQDAPLSTAVLQGIGLQTGLEQVHAKVRQCARRIQGASSVATP